MSDEDDDNKIKPESGDEWKCDRKAFTMASSNETKSMSITMKTSKAREGEKIFKGKGMKVVIAVSIRNDFLRSVQVLVIFFTEVDISRNHEVKQTLVTKERYMK